MRSGQRGPLLWTTLTAVLAFVLGYLGYRSSLPDGFDRLDAVYRTMQLYAMDSELAPASPWPLRVARFLAPLSLAGAAVVAAALLFRDHLQRLQIALRARDHVVVVGLSSSAGAVAESMVALGQRVVVVEADTQHPLLPGLRDLGALVVVGDGRQAVILRRARVDRARHVLVTTGADGPNLEVAHQVRALRAAGARGRASVHVAIDDPQLWLEIGRLTFGHSTASTTIECVNRFDRTGRRVVDTAATVGDLDRVALVGSGPESDRIRAHLLRRARLRGQTVDIVAEPSVATPVVIVSDVGQRFGDAIAVARTFASVQVVVAVDIETADTLLGLLGDLAARVHPVATTPASLAAGLLRDSAIDVMAQARHDDYLEQERAKGLTTSDNSSLVTWDELPESLRDSNRRFAESVAGTLAAMGVSLEPLRDVDPLDLPIAPSDLERLAVQEHDRWEADLRADGWTYGIGQKDPVAKTHPLLVPWDQLSEEDRDKDRDAIRAIPRMLARVGYQLAVVPPG